MSTQKDLTNVSISVGYKQLLHTGETDGLATTERVVVDGDGTNSIFSLGTSSASFLGPLTIGSSIFNDGGFNPGTGSGLGSWSATSEYQAGDIVNLSGDLYTATQASTNKSPATEAAYWELTIAALPMTTITDPAAGALNTAMVDSYSGVVVTLTAAKSCTLGTPTATTAGKTFTVVNKSTNGYNITADTIEIEPGFAQRYLWDGAAWVRVSSIDANDITFNPATVYMSDTDVQSAIDAFAPTSSGKLEVNRALVPDASKYLNFDGGYISNEQTTINMMSKGTVYRFDGVDDLISVADNVQLDPGTGDYGYLVKFSLEDISSDNFIVSRYVDNQNRFFIYYDQAGGNLTAYWQVGNVVLANATCLWTPVAGKEYSVFWSIGNGSSNALYINGVSQTLTANVVTGGDISLAAALQFGRYGAALYSNNVVSMFVPFNFAPTASEVKDLVSGNLDFSKQYGSQTSLITGTDSDFSGAGNWNNYSGATHVVGSGALTVTPEAGTSDSGISLGSAFSGVGKMQRITLTASVSTGTRTVYVGGTSAADEVAGTAFSMDLTTTPTEFSGTLSAALTTIIIGDKLDTGGQTYAIDNITSIPLGAVALYDQTSISATTWYDKANGNNGAVTGASVLNYKGAHTDGTDLIVDNDIMGEGGFAIYENGNANQLYLATGGQNVMGHNASVSIGGSSGTLGAKLQVLGTSIDNSSITQARWATNTASGIFGQAKSRNATIGSYTIVQDGDVLGRHTWSGDDGTNLNTLGAEIRAAVDGTPIENRMPTNIEFYTALGGVNDDIALSAKLQKDAMLDLYGGTISILAGAQDGAKTRNDSTSKAMRFATPHFLNAEEPVATIFVNNSSTQNDVNIGGGDPSTNAATRVNIFGADDYNTTTGTQIATFEGGATKARMMGLGNSSLPAWDTAMSTFNLGGFANLKAQTIAATGNSFDLTNNAYFDGANWKYINTASEEASRFRHFNGALYFSVAPAGTAGNVATFTTALTIANDSTITANGQQIVDASGNLASANGLASFTGAVTNLTVVNGIVTAAS